TGISAKKGALGMSLQTPRTLTDGDVLLLRTATGAPPQKEEKGHLNAHEDGSVTPCLCKKCLPNAPERIDVEGLALIRDRADGGGRFVWYWFPESLAAQKDAIRRSVASRLQARARATQRRTFENLDTLLAGGDDE